MSIIPSERLRLTPGASHASLDAHKGAKLRRATLDIFHSMADFGGLVRHPERRASRIERRGGGLIARH